MTEDTAQKQRGRRAGKGLRWIGGCGFALLIGIGMLLGAYKWNNRAITLMIPTPTMPADNGYDDFVHAGKLTKKMAHLSPYDMSGTTAQNYTYANFKACAPDAIPVQQAVQAGLKKACVCPPVRSAASAEFTNFALFRKTARALAGKAGYEALSGHPGQAADTLLNMLEESTMIARGSLVAGLVAIACEAITTRPFEALIPQLNATELAHVAKRLDAIAAKRVPYADIIAEDANVTTALLLEILHKPSKNGLQSDLQSFTGESSAENTWQGRLTMFHIAFTGKQALLNHTQTYFKALIEEAKLPYAGASKVPADSDPLLTWTAQPFSTSRRKFVTMEAVQAIIRVEVALERYRRAKGRYPAELAQLAPAYLAVVPLDPCISAPLHYQAGANGQNYVLYSVGPDRTDNHALPQKSPGDQTFGDLVARHFWKPLPLVPMPRKASSKHP